MDLTNSPVPDDARGYGGVNDAALEEAEGSRRQMNGEYELVIRGYGE